MRITTWNCYRGDIGQRLSRLDGLRPDLVALQECHSPEDSTLGAIWRGVRPEQGVALVACTGQELEELRVECSPSTAVAARVPGKRPFVCVNLWAHRTPTYESFVDDVLCSMRQRLTQADDLVVLGDFNSAPVFDRFREGHHQLMTRLTGEFGLVSAYHAHHGVPLGSEAHPTHYWLHAQDKPFHLDYCFIPSCWASRLKSVKVGTFGDWPDSDHRPLTVEVDLES